MLARHRRSLAVICIMAIGVLGGCTPSSGAATPSHSNHESPADGERPAQNRADDERELRELLTDPEFSFMARLDTERGKRLYETVERLGRDARPDSVETLFAVLLAAHSDLHLQRAALFSLVRRAPASLALAHELLNHGLPELSRLVHVDDEVTSEQRRLYERGLAAAVLGMSGLPEARAPLREALASTQDVSDRILFVIALTRSARQGEGEASLREALEKTKADEALSAQPLASGLVQLLPSTQDLLLPCSFEIARIGTPVLTVELLAKAGEDLADEPSTPVLLELAERIQTSNPEASASILTSAALLASPSQFPLVREGLQRHRQSVKDDWVGDFVEQLAPAFSRCANDLACHWRVLDEPNVELFQFKSAMFVAARAALDQAPDVLAEMERMSRPYWLAHALDQRLSQPTPEQLARVQRLVPRGPEDAHLYVPHDACSRLDSPLEELAIRLETRMKATTREANAEGVR